jgi:hypothetical protein
MYPVPAIQEALGENISGGFLPGSAFLPMPSVAEGKVEGPAVSRCRLLTHLQHQPSGTPAMRMP